jgi:deoxyribodipyrimidine photolyase
VKAIVAIVPGALRAEQALTKAEKIADETVIAYTFPAENIQYMSQNKARYYALAGICALNHLRSIAKKKTSTVFLYGNAAAEIIALAEREKAELIVAQSWHRSERKMLQELNEQGIPVVTLFGEEPIDPAPLRSLSSEETEQMPAGEKEIEQRILELHAAAGGGDAPKPDYFYRPEDWRKALEHGRALSLYFRIGLVNEGEYLEKLLEDHSGKKLQNGFFNERLKNIARMYFILLKYKDVQPEQNEWWAERSSFEANKSMAQCITETMGKLEASGYLANNERVLLASYLGHHLRVKSHAILSYFERNFIDHEERICRHNLFGVLGLVGHAHVVSGKFARENNLCRNCDKKTGYCTLNKGYAQWIADEEKHKMSLGLSTFGEKD